MFNTIRFVVFGAFFLVSIPMAHANSLASLNDEFTDHNSIDDWEVLTTGPNNANFYESLEVDGVVKRGSSVGGPSGYLTLVPGPGHSGWFQNEYGPYIYKEVSGNFVVETSLSVFNKTNAQNPPTRNYNSAGLIIRDPDTSTNDWLMFNIGRQNGRLGTEHKTTTAGRSQLTIDPDALEGELRICRVGDDFLMVKRLGNDTSWTTLETYPRSDLPNTVQVGIMANGWQSPPDVRADFDYVRFGVPTSIADCTSDSIMNSTNNSSSSSGSSGGSTSSSGSTSSGGGSTPGLCHSYTSVSSIPTGFGVPYDVTSSSHDLLMSVDCDTNGAELTVGVGSQNQYIYEQGYRWDGAAWEQFTMTGGSKTGVWFLGQAGITFTMTQSELASDANFVLSYVCTWTGSEWKCGCQDSACTTPSWQIQKFKQ